MPVPRLAAVYALPGPRHFERWQHALWLYCPKSLQLRGVEKSFLRTGIQGFSHRRQRCNTVTGIFLGDLSTLSHIRFLRLSSPRRLPPLEMTGKGWSHRHDYGIPENAPSRPTSFRAVAACSMTLPPKIATATMSREIFLVFGNTGFLSEIRSYNTVIVIFLGDLSTLSHIRFLRLSSPRRLPPLEMTGKGWSHRHDYGIPENAPSRPTSFRAVAACSMTLPPKIATATMSREIFLVFGNTGFLSEIRSYNTVIVIFLGDLSTLSHIRFLRLSSPRRLPPLEMTGKGWSHRHDYGIPENAPSRPTSFRAVAACYIALPLRIATASRSREIFLVVGSTRFKYFHHLPKIQSLL